MKYATDNAQAFTNPGRPSEADVRAEVHEILSRHMTAKRTDVLPEQIGKAVSWWLDFMMEPEGPDERPREINKPQANAGTAWSYPYARRVIACLRSFIALDENDQQTIKAARKDGVYWRGDSMDTFVRIWDETQRMREVGVADYRKHAKAAMNAALGRRSDAACST